MQAFLNLGSCQLQCFKPSACLLHRYPESHEALLTKTGAYSVCARMEIRAVKLPRGVHEDHDAAHKGNK